MIYRLRNGTTDDSLLSNKCQERYMGKWKKLIIAVIDLERLAGWVEFNGSFNQHK